MPGETPTDPEATVVRTPAKLTAVPACIARPLQLPRSIVTLLATRVDSTEAIVKRRVDRGDMMIDLVGSRAVGIELI